MNVNAVVCHQGEEGGTIVQVLDLGEIVALPKLALKCFLYK